MAGINKVILLGNLGKDPEVRHLEGGATVANFPLATSENHKDKNGNKVEQTEWHNIVLWRSQAEFAEKYLKKGNTVFIEGRIRTRSWEDKEKNKRYITEIIGDNIQGLNTGNGRKEEANAPIQTNASPSESVSSGTSVATDDLPFW